MDVRKSRHHATIENSAHALWYVICFNDKIYFGLYYQLY